MSARCGEGVRGIFIEGIMYFHVIAWFRARNGLLP
ncbi:MAG: hypothetical protein HW380_3535 [Magnetococcales bacterium]|nr:hypothetical protein [Magnetococcales bacterium]